MSRCLCTVTLHATLGRAGVIADMCTPRERRCMREWGGMFVRESMRTIACYDVPPAPCTCCTHGSVTSPPPRWLGVASPAASCEVAHAQRSGSSDDLREATCVPGFLLNGARSLVNELTRARTRMLTPNGGSGGTLRAHASHHMLLSYWQR